MHRTRMLLGGYVGGRESTLAAAARLLDWGKGKREPKMPRGLQKEHAWVWTEKEKGRDSTQREEKRYIR